MKFLIDRNLIGQINEAAGVIGTEPNEIQKSSFNWVYSQIYGDQRPKEFKIPKLAEIHKWALENFGMSIFVYKADRKNTYSLIKLAQQSLDDYTNMQEIVRPKLIKEVQGKPNEIVYEAICEIIGDVFYSKVFETKYLRVENLKSEYSQDVEYWKTTNELIDSNVIRSIMTQYFIRNSYSRKQDKYYFSINDENLLEVYLPYYNHREGNKAALKLIGIKKLKEEQSNTLKTHLETAQDENEYFPELFTAKRYRRRY